MNEDRKARTPLLIVGILFLFAGIFTGSEWEIGYGFGLIVGYILLKN